MSVISAGVEAPPIDGVNLKDGPVALWFFKVTCPVCQLAAPVAGRLAAMHPDAVVGMGQDPGDLSSLENPGSLDAIASGI